MHGITAYEENSAATMEQFIIEHRHLVRKIALYIKRRLPSQVELDDLLQSGVIGLLEARKNYQPDKNATFETFASIRIRGAMIDFLRKNSWVSREAIKSMKQISTAINVIEQRNKSQATTQDIIKELGITLEKYYEISQDVNFLNISRLTESDYSDENLSSDLSNPEVLIDQLNLKENLKYILGKLPEKEKLVLSLYYLNELNFKQIGEVLDLTEARICQLHMQAITRVRAKMELKNFKD